MSNDSQGLDIILDLVAQIQTAKNNIIDQLDANSTDVKATTGDKPGGEGYVVTRDKIKLVPRDRWTPVQVG
jgi:DNA polymerase III alpha subunit (gram-positive type)